MTHQRSPLERKLIRLAYHTNDVELKRGVLETIRLAAYNKEFLQTVVGKKFHNPATDRMVKFVSLPKEEQQKHYQAWLQANNMPAQESAPAQKPAPAAPPQAPAPAPPPTPAPSPATPTMAPPISVPSSHKPTGKHKDRKELRGAGKRKLSDKAQVDEKLKSLMMPPNASAEQQQAFDKEIAQATYENLQELFDRCQKLLKKEKLPKKFLEDGYTREMLGETVGLLDQKLKDIKGHKYSKTVLQIANQYDLEGEDADEVRNFRGDKPFHGKKLTPQELMQKFLAKAKPETKERMQGMSIADFLVMYKSIMSDEEDIEALPESGPAKTAKVLQFPLSNEERQLIHLARQTSDMKLRRHLLSLISRT